MAGARGTLVQASGALVGACSDGLFFLHLLKLAFDCFLEQGQVADSERVRPQNSPARPLELFGAGIVSAPIDEKSVDSQRGLW